MDGNVRLVNVTIFFDFACASMEIRNEKWNNKDELGLLQWFCR